MKTIDWNVFFEAFMKENINLRLSTFTTNRKQNHGLQMKGTNI